MNINNKAFLKFIFGVSTLSALSAPTISEAAGEPPYTPKTATAKLQQYCNTSNFKTLKDHADCLVETSGQVKTFAENFHAGLFTKQKIEANVKLYDVMVSKWEKEIQKKSFPTAEGDFANLKQYATICYDNMQENLFQPSDVLALSYTTGYNIPKFCIDTALDFSKKYGVKIDQKEAVRLQSHLKNIYSFYTANPKIPGVPDSDVLTDQSKPMFDPRNNLQQRDETRLNWI